MSSYHDGHRELQDRFDSRRIADRLEEATYRSALTANDRAFVEAADMFFLATADGDGNPDCSYKGGDPGFVRVVSDAELAWPDYDGNGQYRSLGNARVNPAVALLFIDWGRPARLRIHGRVRLCFDDPELGAWPGAKLVARLAVERVFPNCPRYVHTMTRTAASPYVPREGHEPPIPGWKQDPSLRRRPAGEAPWLNRTGPANQRRRCGRGCSPPTPERSSRRRCSRRWRRSHEVATGTDYVGTPAEALHASGELLLRCRLDREPDRSRFAMLTRQAAAGATDYVMLTLDLGQHGAPWVSFTTRRAGGFARASTSPSSARRSTRSAGSRRCASRWASPCS